jgi:hypothetical protein
MLIGCCTALLSWKWLGGALMLIHRRTKSSVYVATQSMSVGQLIRIDGDGCIEASTNPMIRNPLDCYHGRS